MEYFCHPYTYRVYRLYDIVMTIAAHCVSGTNCWGRTPVLIVASEVNNRDRDLAFIYILSRKALSYIINIYYFWE